jgi:hypothetical protein
MLLAPVRFPVRRISSTTSTASLPMDTLSAPDLRSAVACVGTHADGGGPHGLFGCKGNCAWLRTWCNACRPEQSTAGT